MPRAEIGEPVDEANESAISKHFAKLFVGCVVVSFIVGIVFFFTLAQQRSGSPIPQDAALGQGAAHPL
ncbi:MAG: hypothetical protein GY811_05405 [Myxococcales bacterium]|nr:hypothetical protein [Myxococcales bacterium]